MIIDNIEFARKSLEFHDTIPLLQFSRFKDVLASDQGELDCHLLGNVASDNRLELALSVKGVLRLICQRCLEPFDFNLDITSRFIVVNDESDIPSEEDDLEDYDYLVADPKMQLFELIEDEVLLALPLAPKHAGEDCGADSMIAALKKPSPFQALQNLKRK
ncbi:MAG TPA: YceD family protein [Methyloradius sp.]